MRAAWNFPDLSILDFGFMPAIIALKHNVGMGLNSNIE
jgi:hypothetical protein